MIEGGVVVFSRSKSNSHELGDQVRQPDFFEKQSERSYVKSAIVNAYFKTWAGIMLRKMKASRIGYYDLFCGSGRFEDGSESTPIMVLKTAIEDPDICSKLITVFRDRNHDSVSSLSGEIVKIPGIENLLHRPNIAVQELSNLDINWIESAVQIPSLTFFDPWGYKALSIDLIDASLRGRGSECIFFFNYNRVNAALSNSVLEETASKMMSPEEFRKVRDALDSQEPHQRELTIVDALTRSIRSGSGRYVLPFCFEEEVSSKTSHYLIHVTKHGLGYEIMKEVLYKHSDLDAGGVAKFRWVRADRRHESLFPFMSLLEDLPDILARDFAGNEVRFSEIYSPHNWGRKFIKKHYREALKRLSSQGRIEIVAKDGKAPKVGTFPERVLIRFPERSEEHGKVNN